MKISPRSAYKWRWRSESNTKNQKYKNTKDKK